MTTKKLHNFSTVMLPFYTSFISALILITLIGCSSTSQYTGSQKKLSTTAATSTFLNKKKGGGYYLDDGPDDHPPHNLESIPNAIPKVEPLRKANMKPYTALGNDYKPMTTLSTYKKRGMASWYGRRYHGNQTASGEVYDMYAMTAAHPTLPIPSYAHVTNIKNGKSIIVRINDRGPFLSDRLIDLSYTAAYKLDVLAYGSAPVEVESIIPGTDSTSRTRLRSDTSPSSMPHANPVYLQLGAFGSASNANDFSSQIQAKLPWLANTLGIIRKNGLFKVKIGPYSNQILAQQAADSITRQLAIKPILIID